MVPVLRSLISIPAGISKMNLASFLLLTALGSLIWNTALVIAGAVLGDNWEKALKFLDTYKLIAVIVFAVILAAFIIFKVIKARKKAI